MKAPKQGTTRLKQELVDLTYTHKGVLFCIPSDLLVSAPPEYVGPSQIFFFFFFQKLKKIFG